MGEAGYSLPGFVDRELQAFTGCGDPRRGFARFRCDACHFERLVPFSCKGRGFCPSCGGRRMADLAAHLVDNIFPDAPARQWVLTLPFWLRARVAYDASLLNAVNNIHTRVIMGWFRRRSGTSPARASSRPLRPRRLM